MPMAAIAKKGKLSTFDVTNLVIGAIIGADIYIVSGIASGLVGPASILAWIVAGIFAMVIAMCFADCVMLLPRVGGPYAYAKEAFGKFAGFMTGWSLWLAEWSALAVFPVAFALYVNFFVPLSLWQDILVKFLFILFLTATNYFGIKAAGRANDVLTIAKLAPLFIFMFFGFMFLFLHPHNFLANYQPLLPLGFSGFGKALILIFFAYLGFELATLPANEIENPKKTISQAILLGVGFVMVFYFVTNFLISGIINWSQLAGDATPLATAMNRALSSFSALGFFAAALIGIGALLSISGSDESGTIGTSRLSYAMAADGLFPHSFAKLHPKYKTPYVALLFQSATAFAASIFGSVTQLISFSVFCILIAYFATCLALAKIRKNYNIKIGVVPLVGASICLFMLSQVGLKIMAAGIFVVLIGVPFYIYFSPKAELSDVKSILMSEEYVLKKRLRMEERFLGHLFKHLRGWRGRK